MQEKEGVLEAIFAILANTDQNWPHPNPLPLEGEREKLLSRPIRSREKVRDRQSTDDHGLAGNGELFPDTTDVNGPKWINL